jgi:hypothetical protein
MIPEETSRIRRLIPSRHTQLLSITPGPWAVRNVAANFGRLIIAPFIGAYKGVKAEFHWMNSML